MRLLLRSVGLLPLMTWGADAQDTTVARALPPAVVRVKSFRGPADTVRNLERAGFYDRRTASGAPEKAFATQEQLRRVSMISELVRLTGRPVCTTNLYIDGVRTRVPDLNAPRRGQTYVTKDGIDALLDPWQVAGIEFYKPADTPAQYKATNQSTCGATLIWTR